MKCSEDLLSWRYQKQPFYHLTVELGLAGTTAYVWTDKGYVPEKEIPHKPDKQADAR